MDIEISGLVCAVYFSWILHNGVGKDIGKLHVPAALKSVDFAGQFGYQDFFGVSADDSSVTINDGAFDELQLVQSMVTELLGA
jgi:hypothetical protein